MGKFEDGLIFEVDFNDRDRDGRLVASRTFASSPRKPDVGETVLAHDDEGNRCEGTVSEVKDSIVYIDLDRSTWQRLTVAETPVAVGAHAAQTENDSERVHFELVG
jgi:hypothetical protein